MMVKKRLPKSAKKNASALVEKTMRLPPDLDKKLVERSGGDGISQNTIVILALKEFLK